MIVGGVNRYFHDLGSRYLPDNLREQTVQVATTASRCAALAAITVGSAYLLRERTGTMLMLSIGVSIGGSEYAKTGLPKSGILDEQTARKTARVFLSCLMIAGALTAGLAGLGFLSGAPLLYAGVQTRNFMMALQGLNALLLNLGITVPCALHLLSNSLFFDERIADFQKNPKETISALSTPPLKSSKTFDLESFLPWVDHMPVGLAEWMLLSYVSTSSDEKLSKLIDRFPDILTFQLLEEFLTKERFEKVVRPKLNPPVASEELNKIIDDIKAKQQQPFVGVQEAKRISHELAQHAYKLMKLQKYINKLLSPEVLEKYPAAVQKAKTVTEELLAILASREPGSLGPRLESLLNEEGEPSSNEVLVEYGFTPEDFQKLEERLGVDQIYGLKVQSALVRYHILDVRPDGQALDVDTIIDRIERFYKDPIPNEEEAPAQIAPLPPKSEPVVKLSSVVNHIFYVTLMGSFLGVNLYYNPITTTAGLFARGYVNQNYPFMVSAKPSLTTEAPVDYIHQGFFERVRTLNSRFFLLSLGLRNGSLGGFAAGMVLGGTVLSYGDAALSSLRARIHRLPA